MQWHRHQPRGRAPAPTSPWPGGYRQPCALPQMGRELEAGSKGDRMAGRQRDEESLGSPAIWSEPHHGCQLITEARISHRKDSWAFPGPCPAASAFCAGTRTRRGLGRCFPQPGAGTAVPQLQPVPLPGVLFPLPSSHKHPRAQRWADWRPIRRLGLSSLWRLGCLARGALGDPAGVFCASFQLGPHISLYLKEEERGSGSVRCRSITSCTNSGDREGGCLGSSNNGLSSSLSTPGLPLTSSAGNRRPH